MKHETLLIAVASDFVDSFDVQGCIDFWDDNISILHTNSVEGDWFIVSCGDLDEFSIGDKFKTEDNMDGHIVNHIVLDVINVCGTIVSSIAGNHMVQPNNIATFK